MNRSALYASLAGSLLAFLLSLEAEARAQSEAAETSETSEPSVEPTQRASESTGFGAARTVVLSSDNELSLSYTSNALGTTSKDGASTTTLVVAPAFDYFVVKGFSLGAQLSLLFEEEDPGGGAPATSITGFGIGPRMGAYIPFGKHAGLWPRVGVSFAVASASAQVATPYPGMASNVSSTATAIDFDASSPVVIEAAPHFFIGFGPALSAQITNSVSTTSASSQSVDEPKQLKVGAQLTIGGWL
jgi:hypothetical protein